MYIPITYLDTWNIKRNKGTLGQQEEKVLKRETSQYSLLVCTVKYLTEHPREGEGEGEGGREREREREIAKIWVHTYTWSVC